MQTSLLNASQVARRLSISKAFAYALMRRGEIPAVRMGKMVRVRPEDLEQFIIDNMEADHYGKAAW